LLCNFFQIFFHENVFATAFPLWTVSESGVYFAQELTSLPKFEDCIQRLEGIVRELEQGEVPLERSLTLFEEGMQLSASCRKELEEAEGKVEILLKQNGKVQAEPFER
jgi:exodeoxyribonuclease VII small subunit